MDTAELAARLAAASERERTALLNELGANDSVDPLDLARALKAHYDETESSDPTRAAGAAAALVALARIAPEPEVAALANWTAGMAALDSGQMEEAIARLDQAHAQFTSLGQPHAAASTQVSKLYGLAVLGRYDEALTCGLQARDVFVAHGDDLAAGKIEQNLGNIHHRRGQYIKAEESYQSARDRFAKAGDSKLLVMAENGLANVLTQRHQFTAARQLFDQSLARAESAELVVWIAIIECNIGTLALMQGQYDRALDYLERSRRGYEALGMPHETAIAELEMADAYLELNLAPEAAELYARVIPIFAQLGMQAEQAQATMNHGRAQLLIGQWSQAQTLLTDARTLFQAEGNAVGAANVSLIEAQLASALGEHERAVQHAEAAEGPLLAAGARGRALQARWLRGEALRRLGRAAEARPHMEAALRDAEREGVPQVAHRCLTSLGLLSAEAGDAAAAEATFRDAIAIIEALRAPLPADEARTAFVADKLVPYTEMVRLCLKDGRPERLAEAFGYAERARSRALLDLLGNALQTRLKPRDEYEEDLLRRIVALREELNWFYNQMNRPPDGDAARGVTQVAEWHAEVRGREATLAELTRQLQLRSDRDRDHRDSLAATAVSMAPFDLTAVQRALGADMALIEYFSLDDELMAFVVTDAGVTVAPKLCSEARVQALVEQFRFQINTLRYGAGRMRSHLPQLAERARHYLAQLHDLLFAPVRDYAGSRRLVFVPHRALHYAPLHALFDAESGQYLIERHEVSYAPSAGIFAHQASLAQAGRKRAPQRAVLLGLPDAHIPRVRDEVTALQPLFAESAVLLEDGATHAALRAHAATADVVHLACHGYFRADNPLFSSLQLADGWLTVRDAYDLDLDCQLVALSACETGLNAVTPGDELMGLARGFFLAGAPSLLVSLWTVDDAATADLMREFYTRLLAGEHPAAALREAQLVLLQRQPHPYFWSPFILMGRA